MVESAVWFENCCLIGSKNERLKLIDTTIIALRTSFDHLKNRQILGSMRQNEVDA